VETLCAGAGEDGEYYAVVDQAGFQGIENTSGGASPPVYCRWSARPALLAKKRLRIETFGMSPSQYFPPFHQQGKAAVEKVPKIAFAENILQDAVSDDCAHFASIMVKKTGYPRIAAGQFDNVRRAGEQAEHFGRISPQQPAVSAFAPLHQHERQVAATWADLEYGAFRFIQGGQFGENVGEDRGFLPFPVFVWNPTFSCRLMSGRDASSRNLS